MISQKSWCNHVHNKTHLTLYLLAYKAEFNDYEKNLMSNKDNDEIYDAIASKVLQSK